MAILAWVASLFILLFAPLLFVIPYAMRKLDSGNPNFMQAFAELATKDSTAIFLQVLSTLPVHLLTFLIVWAIVTRFGKRPFWETLGWTWTRHFGPWTCVGLGVVLFLVSSGVAKLLGGDKPTQLDLIINSSPATKYLIAFLATFTAPFAEEFIYRGLLYSSLQRFLTKLPAHFFEGDPARYRVLGKTLAVVFVLALFTIVHVPQYWPNFGVIAAIGLLSIALTVVRAVSGRLLPCVIIHLLFNGVQSVLIVAGYAGPKPNVTPEPVTSFIQPLLHAFHLFK